MDKGNGFSPAQDAILIAGAGAIGCMTAFQAIESGIDPTRITIADPLSAALFADPPQEALAGIEPQHSITARESAGYSLTSSSAGQTTSRSSRMTLKEENDLSDAQLTRDLYLKLQEETGITFMRGNPSILIVSRDDEDAVADLQDKAARIPEHGANAHVFGSADDFLGTYEEYRELLGHAPLNSAMILVEEGYDPEQNPNGVSVTIDPALFLKAMHQYLAQKGVHFEYDTRVSHLRVDEKDTVILDAETKLRRGKAVVDFEKDGHAEEKRFDQVVLAAGPWTQDLAQTQAEEEPTMTVPSGHYPKRVVYVNVVPPEAETLPGVTGATPLPFLKMEDLKVEGWPEGFPAMLPATMGRPDAQGQWVTPGGAKVLGVSGKAKLKDGADALPDHPITREEILDSIAAYEAATGLQAAIRPDEVERTPDEELGKFGSACMVQVPRDKFQTYGRIAVDGASEEQSPFILFGGGSYSTFVLGGQTGRRIASLLNYEPFEEVGQTAGEFYEDRHTPASLQKADSLQTARFLRDFCDVLEPEVFAGELVALLEETSPAQRDDMRAIIEGRDGDVTDAALLEQVKNAAELPVGTQLHHLGRTQTYERSAA